MVFSFDDVKSSKRAHGPARDVAESTEFQTAVFSKLQT
jgi:hypothetical protein